MRGGRGLRIATAGVRTGFAMTLTISVAPPTKSLAEFAARRRQKLRSFFTATCAWGKIPLRLPVWNFGALRQNYARSRLQAP